MKYKIVIALYMRLSQDDGDFDAESNSIINQRLLLHSYVAEHFEDYEVLEFQDDGYSGVNLERPGVSQLLDKVKRGEIDCIIVKDLSRFSRDYIETGSYLEQIFPFAGVRFIAVNDGYDSEHYRGDVAGMSTAFKNLMNDLYCKDISVKVKSALQVKKEKGIYANGSCTFGYCKDPKDRHRLLVVEEEAAIVRRIFQMTLDGVSSHKIAQQFNTEGIKTPIEYKMERGIATMKPKGPQFVWDGSTICQMLRNATYAGDIVYDKYETPEVSGKSRLKPRSQWKIYRNHHEAIIDRETFEYVQKSRGVKSAAKYERYPLIGKLECGYCHKSLKIARTKNPYFFCGGRYVTQCERCIAQINVQFMEQYLLFRLQEEAERQADMQHVIAEAKRRAEQELSEEQKLRKQLTKELEELQEAESGIYERYVFQAIGREEYVKDKKNLQEQIECCKDRKEISDKRIKMLKIRIGDGECGVYEYMQDHSFTELTKEIVDRFIKRIVIYDEKSIEVEWNFPQNLSGVLFQYQLATV